MNQSERRIYLIEELLKEYENEENIKLPQEVKVPINSNEQRKMLRSLMNVRMAKNINEDFLKEQDKYLAYELEKKGIVTLEEMEEVQRNMYIWKGDITRLKVGAIVNAANSKMTGCYVPCHNCIDNCIHTFAGIQLRLECDKIMKKQGYDEPTGEAKITPAYNLPCDYVIHTVGPIVQGRLNSNHEKLLEDCYRNCLRAAEENGIKSIAFCCISTGVFMFPNERAAQIAVATVKKYKEKNNSQIKVIFNVFKDEDEEIYRKILG